MAGTKKKNSEPGGARAFPRTGMFAIGAAAAFALDQLTKYFVVRYLDLATVGSIDVVPPFLNFRMGWNTGVNFGLFADDSQAVRWGLVLLSIVIAGYLSWWGTRPARRAIVVASCGILAGGALGNAYDRVAYGAVADFLNMSCCGIRNPFAFNVADIAIFAGIAGILYFESARPQ